MLINRSGARKKPERALVPLFDLPDDFDSVDWLGQYWCWKVVNSGVGSGVGRVLVAVLIVVLVGCW